MKFVSINLVGSSKCFAFNYKGQLSFQTQNSIEIEFSQIFDNLLQFLGGAKAATTKSVFENGIKHR